MGFPKFETPPSASSATSDHWFLTTVGMRMNDPSSSPWFVAHRCEFPDRSMRYCTTVPPFPLSEIVQSPELRDFEWWVSQNVYYPMPRNGRNPEPLANTRATGAPVELCIVLTKPKLNGDDSKKNSGPLKKTCDFRRLQTPQTFLQV